MREFEQRRLLVLAFIDDLVAQVNTVPDVFSSVWWDAPSMLDDVEAAARTEGRDVRRCAEWHDVDTPDDVRVLADRLRIQPE